MLRSKSATRTGKIEDYFSKKIPTSAEVDAAPTTTRFTARRSRTRPTGEAKEEVPAAANVPVPDPEVEEEEEVQEEEEDEPAAVPDPDPEEEEVQEEEEAEAEAEAEAQSESSREEDFLQWVAPLKEIGVLAPVRFVHGPISHWPQPNSKQIDQQAKNLRSDLSHVNACRLHFEEESIEERALYERDLKAYLSRTGTNGVTVDNVMKIEQGCYRDDVKTGDVLEQSQITVVLTTLVHGAHARWGLHPVVAYLLLKFATHFKPVPVTDTDMLDLVRPLFMPCLEVRGGHMNVMLCTSFWSTLSELIAVHTRSDIAIVASNIFQTLKLIRRLQLQLINPSTDDNTKARAVKDLAKYLGLQSEWDATEKMRCNGNNTVDWLIRRAKLVCDDGDGARLYFRGVHETHFLILQSGTAAMLNEHNRALRQLQTIDNFDRSTSMIRNFVNQFNHVSIRADSCVSADLSKHLGRFQLWKKTLSLIANGIKSKKPEDADFALVSRWFSYFQLLAYTTCVPKWRSGKMFDSHTGGSVMEVYLDVLFLSDKPASVIMHEFTHGLQHSYGNDQSTHTLHAGLPVHFDLRTSAFHEVWKSIGRNIAALQSAVDIERVFPACSTKYPVAPQLMRSIIPNQHMGWIEFKNVFDDANLSRLQMDKRKHGSDRMLFAVIPDGDEKYELFLRYIDSMPPAVASCTVLVNTGTPDALPIYMKQLYAYMAAPTQALKKGLQDSPDNRGLASRRGVWSTVGAANERMQFAGIEMGEFARICDSHLKESTIAIITDRRWTSFETLFLEAPPSGSKDVGTLNAMLFWEQQLSVSLQKMIGAGGDVLTDVMMPILDRASHNTGKRAVVVDFVYVALYNNPIWADYANIYTDRVRQDKPIPVATQILIASCSVSNTAMETADFQTIQKFFHSLMLALIVSLVVTEVKAKNRTTHAHEINMAWRIIISMLVRAPTCITEPSLLNRVGVWRFNGKLLYTHENLLAAMRDYVACVVFELSCHYCGSHEYWTDDVTQPPIDVIGTPVLPISGLTLIARNALLKYGVIPMKDTVLGAYEISEETASSFEQIRKRLQVINDDSSIEYVLTRRRLCCGVERHLKMKKNTGLRQIRRIIPHRNVYNPVLDQLHTIRTSGESEQSLYSAWNTLFFYMPTPAQTLRSFVKQLDVDKSSSRETDNWEKALRTLSGVNFEWVDTDHIPKLFQIADGSEQHPHSSTAAYAGNLLQAAVAAITADEVNRIARLVESTKRTVENRIRESSVEHSGSADVILAGAISALVEHSVCAHGHQLIAIVMGGPRGIQDALDMLIRNVALQFAVRTLACRSLDMCVSTNVLLILVIDLVLNLEKICYLWRLPRDESGLAQFTGALGMATPEFELDMPISISIENGVELAAQESDVAALANCMQRVVAIVYQPACIIANTIRVYDEKQDWFAVNVYPAVLNEIHDGKPLKATITATLDELGNPGAVFIQCFEIAVQCAKIENASGARYMFYEPDYIMKTQHDIIRVVRHLRLSFDSPLWDGVQSQRPSKNTAAAYVHTQLKLAFKIFIKYATTRIVSTPNSDSRSNTAWVEELGKALMTFSDIITAEKTESLHKNVEYRYAKYLTEQLESIASVFDTHELTYPGAQSAYWKTDGRVVQFAHAASANEAGQAIANANVNCTGMTMGVWVDILNLFSPPGTRVRRSNAQGQPAALGVAYKATRLESKNGPVIDLINGTRVKHKFRMWFLAMQPAKWVASWSEGKWSDSNAFVRYKAGVPLSRLPLQTSVADLIQLFKDLSTWDKASYKDSFKVLGINEVDTQWKEFVNRRIDQFKELFGKTQGMQMYAFLLPVVYKKKRHWTYASVSIPTTLGLATPSFFGNHEALKTVIVEIPAKPDDGLGGDNATFNLSVQNAYLEAKPIIEEMVKLLLPAALANDQYNLPDPIKVQRNASLKQLPREAYRQFAGSDTRGIFGRGAEKVDAQFDFEVMDEDIARVENQAGSKGASQALLQRQRAVQAEEQRQANLRPKKTAGASAKQDKTSANGSLKGDKAEEMANPDLGAKEATNAKAAEAKAAKAKAAKAKAAEAKAAKEAEAKAAKAAKAAKETEAKAAKEANDEPLDISKLPQW